MNDWNATGSGIQVEKLLRSINHWNKERESKNHHQTNTCTLVMHRCEMKIVQWKVKFQKHRIDQWWQWQSCCQIYVAMPWKLYSFLCSLFIFHSIYSIFCSLSSEVRLCLCIIFFVNSLFPRSRFPFNRKKEPHNTSNDSQNYFQKATQSMREQKSIQSTTE